MPRFFDLPTGWGRKAKSAKRFNGSRRLGCEWLEPRLCLSGAALTSLPLFTFTKATTKDASSVAVDYTIATADITQALTFDVYRSDKTVLDGSSVLLGETTIDPAVDSQKLTQGTHAAVSLIQGTVLTPNTTLPYIVVVANRNGNVAEDASSVNTTYFRTFELGVVVHGKESGSTVPAWETTMASDLKKFDHYDNVIAFNWAKDSSTSAQGLATKAGDTLYSQIVNAAASLEASHAGDVVDLHLIGHSRGAVVVSRALQDVAGKLPTALSGSYVKATLLDPHPSNTADAGLYSVQSGFFGAIAVNAYLNFESATKDPEVVLPAGAGIKSIEVDYQHTPASGFPSSNTERVLNLWGEGQNDGYLINQSGVPIQWQNLTSVKDPKAGLIGHSEIHTWYQLRVVDVGAVSTPAIKSSVVSVNTTVATAAPTSTITKPATVMVSAIPVTNSHNTGSHTSSAIQSFWELADEAFI